MKVLHIINNLNREGAQVVVANLVTALRDDGVRHVVCTREPCGALQPGLEQRGVRVRTPQRYYRAAEIRHSLRFLMDVTANETPDLVHAHMADAALLGWLVTRSHRLPLVITHHGDDLLPRCRRICRAVHWLALLVAGHTAAFNVAVSPSVERRLRRVLRLPARRIRIVANGVPLPGPSAAGAARGGRGPQIVAVGRLIDLKAHDRLITAASLLADEFPAARFTIIGGGPLDAQLRAQAACLGLGNRVRFTGVVDDVTPYLRDADLFVSTSYREGMSMAILEAMASGAPVVAADIPGNRTIVEHGATGWLYPAGDAEALAGCIKEVLARPEDARRRAEAARRMVEQRYSAAAAAREYARLYAETLGLPRLDVWAARR